MQGPPSPIRILPGLIAVLLTLTSFEALPALAQVSVRQQPGEIVVNSIDRDGRMQGYDLELAQRLAAVEQRVGRQLEVGRDPARQALPRR